MILKDFLELLITGSTKIEIRSAYNGKLLCKKYPDERKADMLCREVVMCETKINCNNSIAWPVLVIYLHGDVELEEEMQRKKAKCSESSPVDQRE